jgi:hypothetical protein
MKLRVFTFFVITVSFGLICSCSKHSGNPTPMTNDTPNLTNGLVLYLPFNGSLSDESGLNNTVTAVGGGGLGYDLHGYAQSAYNGTGNGSYLYVANNGSYKVDTAFAASFDFMTRASASYAGGGNFDGLPVFLSIVTLANGNGPAFNVGYGFPGVQQYLYFGVNGSASDCGTSGVENPKSVPDTSFVNPQLGAWYNMIVQFSHGTLTTYINGHLVSTKTDGPDSVLFCPNANFVIGGWWGGHQSLNGGLDEVRFYNHTLNAQQIAWLSRNFQLNSTSQQPGRQQGKGPALN